MDKGLVARGAGRVLRTGQSNSEHVFAAGSRQVLINDKYEIGLVEAA